MTGPLGTVSAPAMPQPGGPVPTAGPPRPTTALGRRLVRVGVLVVTAALATAAIVVSVQYADGALSGQYQLTALFSQSGEGLHPGSQVTYRGVQVGRVTGIALVDRHARVTMAIDHGFRVPADATATIRPLNVFGADVVSLAFSRPDAAPALQPGGVIRHSAVSDELGDLFAAADPLLAQIDTADLSTIVSTLAQASEGEGPTIAASIDEGAKLAAFLDRTLPSQLRALDAFNGFAGALAPTGASLDAISAASNQTLPAFNADAAHYQQLLSDLAPFAEELAQLLAAYRPDITTLLDDGDNIARVLLVRQQQVGQVIQGLGVYLTKFANAIDPAETLPDGSHFGYFQTFVLFSDINALVCNLIAPAAPGLSFLAPLQQVLTGPGSPLDCSSQLAAFAAAQQGAPSAPATAAAQQAAKRLATDVYGQLAAPEPPATPPAGGGSGNVLQQLLGALL